MSDTILSQLLYINGIWKCTDGKAFSNQYNAYIHQLELNGQGGLKSKVSQPSMIRKLEGEINKLKKEIDELKKNSLGYDFNTCAEPFNMGNLVVISGNKKDWKVSLGSSEFLPIDRLFKIPSQGIDVKTKGGVIPLNFDEKYEYEVELVDSHPNYYSHPDDLKEAVTKNYQLNIISPTKHLEKDPVFSYYSWAYNMFNSWKDWQEYNCLELNTLVIGTDTPSHFNDSNEFMLYISDKYRENIGNVPEPYGRRLAEWRMPVVFFNIDSCDYSCSHLLDESQYTFIETRRKSSNNDEHPSIYNVRYYDLGTWMNANNRIGYMSDWVLLRIELQRGLDSNLDIIRGIPLIFPEGKFSQDPEIHQCMFSELIQNCIELWNVDMKKLKNLPYAEDYGVDISSLLLPQRIVIVIEGGTLQDAELRNNSWYENEYLAELGISYLPDYWFTELKNCIYNVIMKGLYSFIVEMTGNSGLFYINTLRRMFGLPYYPMWTNSYFNEMMYACTLVTRALLGYYHEIYG